MGKNRRLANKLDRIFEGYGDYADPIEEALNKVEQEALKETEDLKARIRSLEHVIQEIQWMARRYAHGRMTYAVSQYNEAIQLAQRLGMEFRPDPIDGLVEAKDGMFDKEWFEQNKERS